MAVHAAVDAAVFYYKRPFTLYTYGAPRVGDWRFVQFFDKVFQGSAYRITNGHDPVPHVPPKAWAFNHASTEIYYYDETHLNYVVCKDVNEDRNCSNKHFSDLKVMDHLTYLDYNFIQSIGICTSS